ncbi:serine endoprotease DegQ [Candidatus Thiomargarita nelsonii]|uniref:Serine endoprotease DegQ n=1 Tax=Candidatus Thiomargarita nelsonii TaxID=1003181 RepID=A0A0A6PF35_9GAMM|nr:serine endoprotease DegQ [Candidatus Thiomargarita nelsonii]
MYKHKYHSLWLVLVILFIGQPSCAELPARVGGQILPSLAPMLEKAMPAVVNISSTTRTRAFNNPLLNDPFFRHFFDIPKEQEKQSRGSGVIINASKGYVITNHHVIEKADEISVMLLDGRQFNAKLIGEDPETDVALLKISADNLTALSLADSDKLRVGDFVVAIGNPFGLGQTVTSGIISGLQRSGLGIEGYENFIQTDASINPGNSGGALIDLRGELVGINTAILAPSGGNVGIGFAIPSNMVQQVAQHLTDFGEVRRGVLGVQIQDLTTDLAAAFGLSGKKGAVVVAVEPNSPAKKAGLRSSDIITAINNKAVNSATAVRNRIGLLRIGERVKITLIRKGRTRHLYVVIADSKRVEGSEISVYLEGAVLKESSDGIKVSKVTRNSNAWQIGLRRGDKLVGINRKEVNDLDEFKQRFSWYKTPRSIQILRDGKISSIWLKK